MNCDTQHICDIKIALTHNGRIRTFLRDDVTGIPFPAYWDLPGGPCLDDGSVPDAAIQHLAAFLHLNIDPAQILQVELISNGQTDGRDTYLCVVELTAQQMEALQAKQVGTRWRDMPLHDFFAHPRTIPMLKNSATTLTDPSGRGGKVAA